MSNFIKTLFFVLSLFVATTAQAQKVEVDATTRVVESIKSEEMLNYHEIATQISILEDNLKNGQQNTDMLSNSVKVLSDFRTKLAHTRKETEKELQFVQKRIEALGEASEDEAETITAKRKEFSDEASSLKAVIAESDVMIAKIDELDNLILSVRNKQLIGNLLVQQKPIIIPHNFFHATSLFVKFTLDIIKSPVNWYSNLDEAQRNDMHLKFIPGTLIFILLLWLAIYLRLFITHHFGYKKDVQRPRFGKKVFAAILVAISYGVIPAVLIAGFMIWLYSTKIVDGTFFGIVLNSFLFYLLVIFLTKAFTRVIFAPYNPHWRLVNVDTKLAKKITQTLYVAIASINTCSFFEGIAVSSNYSIDLIAFISIFASALKGLFIILLTKIVLLDSVSSIDEEEEDDDETPQSDAINRSVKIIFLTILAVSVVFIISLFGYARLSAFIFNRFILSVLVCGALILLRKLISEFFHHMLFFKFWFRTFKLRRHVRVSIDFWINLVLDPIFILLGVFIILSLWGVSTDLLLQSLKKLFTGFKVGGINISIIAIALGIIAFFTSLAFFKMLRTKFFNQVLNKMNIDDGVRHSLSAGLGFVSFVLAAIIGIVVMGGDLTNLAIIASALSVGIGFGLQNIINNFVSGIIILFERPFKVGDWVSFNGEEGTIKQINIRSTEIETFKRASIIVPNASLISSAVTNLTHENTWSRQAVSVGVAYGTDVEKVKQILLDVAHNHKYVLKNPAPYVLFKDFGASSLDFELRCYTSNLWNGWTIPSDLRFEIYKRFNDEGIEIPFQQVVVHQAQD